MNASYPHRLSPRPHQRGASMAIVLIILGIVSVLGVTSLRITSLGERGARNDRDYQIAWQSSEAALHDAEMDLQGISTGASTPRAHLFAPGKVAIQEFVTACGNSTTNRGLCAYTAGNTPAWLTVDFTQTSGQPATTAFGAFTAQTFPSGYAGPRPAALPRYAIEAIPDPSRARTTDPSTVPYVYRVTAMGFGPKPETQVVLQMLYRN